MTFGMYSLRPWLLALEDPCVIQNPGKRTAPSLWGAGKPFEVENIDLLIQIHALFAIGFG